MNLADSITELPQRHSHPPALGRRSACSCLLSAAFCCLPGLKAQAAALAANAIELTEVAAGVHVFHGVHEEATGANLGAIANTAVIVGADAVAVVDSGGSLAWGTRLRSAIRSLTALPIRHVINSHVHPDHIFGNAAFDRDGPEIWGHYKLPESLAARGQYYLEQVNKLLGAKAEGTRVVAPTRLVNGAQELDLGGRVLRLESHPTAHTDNDLTVFDDATRTLLTGDLLFMERLPAIDGSLNGWLAAMAALGNTPAARVVPGHGPVSAPWPAALEPQERYLQRLRADLRDLIAAGIPMEKAVETAGRSEGAHWQLFDDYNARNVVTAYAELEWE
jgi:quinoprotein relay system zinc metallohydrolase 2